MCEQCYNLKNSLELFIENQSKFYQSIGLNKTDAKEAARRDLEQHIDSLPVKVGKVLYEAYKQIG